MSKFILVDGNSLVHRAFHALPLLQNSSGEYTNAVYGFIMMFQRAIRELAPTHGAVAFDVSKRTFRSEIFNDYKATRKETPLELRGQFTHVKEVIRAFGFKVVEAEGYEADDIIGTLSTQAAKEGHDVFILTGDRDAFQLISPAVSVYLTRKGISETEIFDENALYEKYGLTPKQIIDLKALMGDSSDNIPGIPGVGEKTALKLLLEYGTLDNLYNHVHEIKGKLKEKLNDNKELAYISHNLATIDTEVQLSVQPDNCKINPENKTALKSIYEKLGFKTLLRDLHVEKAGQQETAAQTIQEELEFNEAASLKEILSKKHVITYCVYEGNPIDVAAKELYFANETSFFAVSLENPDKGVFEEINNYFSSEETKVFHDLKTAYLILENTGFKLNGHFHDLSLMAYLINPGVGKYSPQEISLDILKASLQDNDHASAAVALSKAYPVLINKLKEQCLTDLYQSIELPLVSILAGMENHGVNLDVGELQIQGVALGTKIEELSKEIYALADEEFNINSPKQLGKILFEKLNLPIIKKTKTGYSTGAEVLEELAELHEIAAKIVEYRTLSKIKSTYIEGLQNARNLRTGKLHTSFNQTITSTGRLSSTEPNLQNIPIRMDVGKQIRKAFKASDNNVLLAADYSQIELRILAHISQDKSLIDAFVKEQDIHTRTAQEVFGVDEAEVTSEMRRRAKAVNFGIVYGISDFGLSRDLHIPRKEAKTYIENYFLRYPGVKAYLDNVILQAREDGFVTTIFNRRRYLPDLFSSNKNVRNFGERTAMNTPIQGSAADIIKLAMIKIEKAFELNGYKAKMLLQVHDELIFDVPVSELREVAATVKTMMEQACELSVPLVADLKVGENWYEMLKYTGGDSNA